MIYTQESTYLILQKIITEFSLGKDLDLDQIEGLENKIISLFFMISKMI